MSAGCEEDAIREALERLCRRIAERDPALLDEFADPESLLLAGSDPDEFFTTAGAAKAQLEAILALPAAIRFAWDEVAIRRSGAVGWLLARGRCAVGPEGGPVEIIPYRLSGVLERTGGRWRWQLFHGAAAE